MPYNEGPSLDMSTIKDFAPETTFVQDPNTFDLAAMYDRKTVNPIGHDINNLSFDDIKNKTNEYSQKIMDMFGINKGEEKEEAKPANDESLADQVKFEDNLSSKTNTKSLQNYMANPDDDLKSMIGDKKYNGPIDGIKNDELDELTKYLEASIAKTIGNKDVFGVINNTHVGDVKAAIKKVVSYKKYLMKVKVGNMSLDDRFVELAKFIK